MKEEISSDKNRIKTYFHMNACYLLGNKSNNINHILEIK
jgi:hypothetical protein